MQFDSSQPIWQQLLADFTRKIIIGEWPPEARVPSTRDLALQYRVNPNTVQRALAELDRMGVTHSERTAGRFVREDPTVLRDLRMRAAEGAADAAIAGLRSIGVSLADAKALIERRWHSHD